MTTLAELRSRFRLRTLDIVKSLNDDPGYLWSDAELNSYYNESVNEAASRAQLLYDQTTEEICNIPVLADVATYPLDPCIIELASVKLDSRIASGTGKLDHATRDELDEHRPGWEVQSGQVTHYLDDTTSIQLWRIPAQADLLRLAVYRLPLSPMVDDRDEPEIQDRWHDGLDYWAFHLAFQRQNAETYNPKLAMDYEMEFERRFGRRRDANVLRKQRDRKPPVVAPGFGLNACPMGNRYGSRYGS